MICGSWSAALLLLLRRTFLRAVTAEHATIAWLWPQQRLAVDALVEEQTGVGGHDFFLPEAALWTSNQACEDKFHWRTPLVVIRHPDDSGSLSRWSAPDLCCASILRVGTVNIHDGLDPFVELALQ